MLFYLLLLCETVFAGLSPSSWIVEAARQGVAWGKRLQCVMQVRWDQQQQQQQQKGFMRGAVALTDLKTHGLQPDVREEFMISVLKWSRSAAMVREGERRAKS